jgi:hypothetical protein
VVGVVTRSLTGHVTEKMRLHYSTVGMDEKRDAVASVAALLGPMGDREGDRPRECSGPIEPRRRQVLADALENRRAGDGT